MIRLVFMEQAGTILISIVAVSVIFTLIERCFARGPQTPTWQRPDVGTDVGYALGLPIFSKLVTEPLLAVLLVSLYFLIVGKDGPVEDAGVFNTPITALSYWVQVPLILVLGDLLHYWLHRMFHLPGFWRYHAVHHSSPALDWLSSARFHPVEKFIHRFAEIIPLYLCGFAPGVLLIYITVQSFWGLVVHSYLPWDFGPFRYVLASPAYHRWHHAAEAAYHDKNFAGLFPFLDTLFGTLYLPKGESPTVLGDGGHVPEGFWNQLVYPFKAATPQPPSREDA
ncbi:MAG: sterol desaturase family protein [bacterium]